MGRLHFSLVTASDKAFDHTLSFDADVALIPPTCLGYGASEIVSLLDGSLLRCGSRACLRRGCPRALRRPVCTLRPRLKRGHFLGVSDCLGRLRDKGVDSIRSAHLEFTLSKPEFNLPPRVMTLALC
jgi:hypothetical protein